MAALVKISLGTCAHALRDIHSNFSYYRLEYSYEIKEDERSLRYHYDERLGQPKTVPTER